MFNIKEEYEKRKNDYENLVKEEKKSISLISNLRLVTFLLGVVATVFFYLTNNHYVAIAVAAAFLIIFMGLVKMHNKATERKDYAAALYDINDKSLKRINGDWKQFSDNGEEYINDEHRYSMDLDIFGRGSIFQWINTTVTYLGREKLRELLENPSKEIEEIHKRQGAVKELAEKLDFRQNLIAEGSITNKEANDPENLFKWGNEQKVSYCKPMINLIIYVWPLVTIAGVLLPFVTNVPFYVAGLIICINIIFLIRDNENRSISLATVDKYKENIRNYYGMLKVLEEEDFNSNYIKEIKASLINGKGDTAWQQIRKLSIIEEKVAGRRNAYYSIINVLTLSDYRYMRSLEMWKRDSGRFIKQWINALGEIEALSSLAIIRYDNPEWTMARFVKNPPRLSAKAMGHPLLTGERVCNDLKMEKPSGIILITGSNMSGKSTLLRTSGINLVLAYAGAPVCAEEFTCSIMEIYTCMRVSDDLERSISSFYAELLRIKKIVQATKEDKQIFFLLDEIFKGTNSMDRHTGAKVLVNKLRKEGAIGLVSTHDLELAELEEESRGQIKNYHFREYYKNQQIHFDYKLRPGVSTTRNALYLINMVGIEIDE